MSKSTTPKVARGKTGKENPNAASKIRTRKTNKTKPESAPSAAAKPHEKGRKTATQKMVSAQRRDSHRKAAPIAVAVVPKAVVEKPRDSHLRTAPKAVVAVPKAVAEEARDPHHKAAPIAVAAVHKAVAEKPRDTHPKAARIAVVAVPKAVVEKPRDINRKGAPLAVAAVHKAVVEKPRDIHPTAAQEIASERLRDSDLKAAPAQFEKPRESQVPDTMRALAERNITQTREIYERSKNTLEAVLDSCEKCFGLGGQGAVALNRKIIDIAERNINTGFDLAMSLAGAKNLAEVMELQAAYWRKLFGELQTQAKEVRALSTKVTADATKPIKDA